MATLVGLAPIPWLLTAFATQVISPAKVPTVPSTLTAQYPSGTSRVLTSTDFAAGRLKSEVTVVL